MEMLEEQSELGYFIEHCVTVSKSWGALFIYRMDVDFWKQRMPKWRVPLYLIHRYGSREIYNQEMNMFYLRSAKILEEKEATVQSRKECRQYQEARGTDTAKRQDEVVRAYYNKKTKKLKFMMDTFNNAYEINKRIRKQRMGEKIVNVADGEIARVINSGTMARWIKADEAIKDFEVTKLANVRKVIKGCFSITPWKKTELGIPTAEILLDGTQILFYITAEEHDAFLKIVDSLLSHVC